MESFVYVFKNRVSASDFVVVFAPDDVNAQIKASESGANPTQYTKYQHNGVANVVLDTAKENEVEAVDVTDQSGNHLKS